MSEEQMNAVTNQIINCAYTVSNVLGCGFLEKIYENALFVEMKMSGLNVFQQHNIPVYYKGMNVGNYSADLIVESSVLVELKAIKELSDVHTAQCLNYLKATNLSICLLLNFGTPRVDVKRIVNNF